MNSFSAGKTKHISAQQKELAQKYVSSFAYNIKL
jgi:hypothetical protein